MVRQHIVAGKSAEQRDSASKQPKASSSTNNPASSSSNRNTVMSFLGMPLPRSQLPSQSSKSAPTQVVHSRFNSTSSVKPKGVPSAVPMASSRPVLSSRENTSNALKQPFSRQQLVKKSPSVEHVMAAPNQQQKPKLTSTIRNIARDGNKDKATANYTQANQNEQELKKAHAAFIDLWLGRTKELLRANGKATDVFIIMALQLDKKLALAENEQVRLRDLLEQSSSEHASAIEDLERSWQRRLQKVQEEHRDEVSNIREEMASEHNEKLQRANQQHQQTTSELVEQVQKLEDQLKEQQRKHMMELSESENTTINRLNKELESRKYELQMKGEELAKLRQANRELQFAVDKLPEKDIQVGKLEARNVDLRDELNRLKQIEKKLVAQLEEFRHDLSESRAKTELMAKEKEVLEFQLNEQHEISLKTPSTPKTPSAFIVPNTTPNSVKLRTSAESQRKGAERPNSSCLSHGRVGTPHRADGAMSRSVDSAMSQSVISCYVQEGRSKAQNTPSKIYTPRDVIEVSEPVITAKRTVNFDSTHGDSSEAFDDHDDSQKKVADDSSPGELI